jgi:phosphoglycolate phosphatase/putative hydrolase of the HAD superfamily
MRSALRCILLDVDGTLYDQRRLRRAMFRRLLRFAVRRPYELPTVVRALHAYRACQDELRGSDALEPAVPIATVQLQRAARRAGLQEDRVREIAERWMEREPLPLLAACVRSGLGAFLQRASRAGVPVGVVSDYPAAAKLETLGVASLVRVVVCAQDAEVGRFKPDPRGLLLAARRLGVAPAAVLYVGDRPEVDAAAATAAGMRCAIIGPQSRARPNGATARVDPAWLPVDGFESLGELLFAH